MQQISAQFHTKATSASERQLTRCSPFESRKRWGSREMWKKGRPVHVTRPALCGLLQSLEITPVLEIGDQADFFRLPTELLPRPFA
jgi:hypothetical protein